MATVTTHTVRELAAETTVSRLLAREAIEWEFEQLPPEVVHEAKRRVVDMLGCVLGGYDSPPSVAIQKTIRQLAGPAEATVYGSGLRTSCMNAALANGVMLRFTEAMDRSSDGPNGRVSFGHPGEVVPCVLAVAERQHLSGRDVISAIVLGYQLINRLSYAMGGSVAVSRYGWKHEIRWGIILPLIVGKLLRLSEDQIVNAVGIAACYTGQLGILDHGQEVVTMARELRTPYAAYQAIFAALMAQNGLEGPSRVLEGHHGFSEVMVRGNIDFARLTRRDDDFSIMYTWTKLFPVNGKLQGQTEAAIRLVTEHDIAPERISKVRIRTSARVLEAMANPGTHKYPSTKETADHSAYFTAALAIVDRDVHLNLDQFTAQRLTDPRIRSVIDKIELEAVPDWNYDRAPTEVEIITVDNEHFTCRIDHPKGHVLNPLTDSEIEQKFVGMASRWMEEGEARRVLAAIWAVDELSDIGQLTDKLVFAR